MRRILVLLIIAITVLVQDAATAADPQPYSVTLKPTGNKTLDGALHDASSLISLQDKAPVGGFSLVERARQDLDRFQTGTAKLRLLRGEGEPHDRRPSYLRSCIA